MDRTLKIGIACLLGAGVGTAVALEVHHLFWWVGLIVGGLIGYLSYEFKEVLAAIKTAWQSVINWRPDREELKKLGWSMLSTFAFIQTVTLGMMMVILIAALGKPPTEALPREELLRVWCFLCLAICVALSPTGIVFYLQRDESVEGLRFAFRHANFLAVYIYYPLKGMIWLLKNIPRALWLCCRFIAKVFTLIHSDIRLLCGLDAALGTAVGFFAGSILIGALSGLMIGILNYEIITKRILCLQPVNKT